MITHYTDSGYVLVGYPDERDPLILAYDLDRPELPMPDDPDLMGGFVTSWKATDLSLLGGELLLHAGITLDPAETQAIREFARAVCMRD